MENKKIEFNSLKLEELEDLFLSLGEKKFRAEQFFRFMHQKKNYDIENCKQLPKVLIEKLKDIGFINASTIYTKYESKIDNTKKYLIKFLILIYTKIPTIIIKIIRYIIFKLRIF